MAGYAVTKTKSGVFLDYDFDDPSSGIPIWLLFVSGGSGAWYQDSSGHLHLLTLVKEDYAYLVNRNALADDNVNVWVKAKRVYPYSTNFNFMPALIDQASRPSVDYWPPRISGNSPYLLWETWEDVANVYTSEFIKDPMTVPGIWNKYTQVLMVSDDCIWASGPSRWVDDHWELVPDGAPGTYRGPLYVEDNAHAWVVREEGDYVSLLSWNEDDNQWDMLANVFEEVTTKANYESANPGYSIQADYSMAASSDDYMWIIVRWYGTLWGSTIELATHAYLWNGSVVTEPVAFAGKITQGHSTIVAFDASNFWAACTDGVYYWNGATWTNEYGGNTMRLSIDDDGDVWALEPGIEGGSSTTYAVNHRATGVWHQEFTLYGSWFGYGYSWSLENIFALDKHHILLVGGASYSSHAAPVGPLIFRYDTDWEPGDTVVEMAGMEEGTGGSAFAIGAIAADDRVVLGEAAPCWEFPTDGTGIAGYRPTFAYRGEGSTSKTATWYMPMLDERWRWSVIRNFNSNFQGILLDSSKNVKRYWGPSRSYTPQDRLWIAIGDTTTDDYGVDYKSEIEISQIQVFGEGAIEITNGTDPVVGPYYPMDWPLVYFVQCRAYDDAGHEFASPGGFITPGNSAKIYFSEQYFATHGYGMPIRGYLEVALCYIEFPPPLDWPDWPEMWRGRYPATGYKDFWGGEGFLVAGAVPMLGMLKEGIMVGMLG